MIPALFLSFLLLPTPQQTPPTLAAKSLSLRVIDESGAVPTGLSVRAQAYVGEEVVGGVYQVPEDGRLLLTIPPALYRNRCSRLVVVPAPDPQAPADWARAALLDLPTEQAGMDLDLGDLQLGSAPPLYAGKVLDDLGQPVVGALVTLDSQKSNMGPENPQLFETLMMNAATDAEGAFLLTGMPGYSPEEIALRVTAVADGYQQVDGEIVEPGRTDLVITLARAGSATISWILPPNLPAAAVGVHMAPMEADPDATMVLPIQRTEYTLPKLAPGVYRLTLLDEVGNPIQVVEGVEIHPGEVCADERLVDIDLQPLTEILQLSLRAEAGRVLETPASVWRLQPTQGRYQRAGRRGTNRDDWRVLLAKGATADLFVAARGYRPAVLEGVAGEQEVRMARSLAITLQIVGASEYEREGRFLGLTMLAYPLPDPQAPFRPGFAAELFGAGPVRGPQVQAHLPGPGEYLVRWNVYERGADGRPSFVGTVDGDLLELTEASDGSSIETPLPPEVWTLQADE